MKELKPFRSPRTSASFPEAEAAILIFLELTKKKDPHIYSENCTAAIQNSTSLVPLLCRSTDTSIVIRRAGPYISLAEPQYSQRGSGLFFKPLRSSVGWDRCMSWSTVWHLGMHSYATLPASLLVYSPALAPFICPWCLTCRSDSRGS